MSRKGYIDLQVNGYGGTDFNDPAVTLEQIHQACRLLQEHGTAQILATVITASPARMMACLKKLVRARADNATTRETMAGFHVEGPFLSREPGYPGAHPSEEIRMAEIDLMERLLAAGDGLVRMFTLAPEADPDGKVTRLLADQAVVVSAGHTDASLDELKACIDQGLSCFTHLGNGCPMQLHRHDNIIQRALSLREYLHFGLIADGVHVPGFALRNYMELAGIERCFVVTDAMAAAGLGPGRYALGGQTVEVDETQAVWSADRSHFVGSAATMPRCAAVLAESGFGAGDIHRLTMEHPARIADLKEKGL